MDKMVVYTEPEPPLFSGSSQKVRLRKFPTLLSSHLRLQIMGQSRPTGMGEWFKGIVSRDSGGLQMILLGRFFNVSASSLFLFVSAFSYRIFKNSQLSGASFQHSSSNEQYSSGD